MLAPEQIEFLAGVFPVDIVPTIRLDGLQLAGRGRALNLRPNDAVTVPLWLARLLREARHCRILCPPFMRPSSLRAALRHEQGAQPSGDDVVGPPLEGFAPLPPHWYEVAVLLLKTAAEDLALGRQGLYHGGRNRADADTHDWEDYASIPLLVQTLREVRASKLAHGFPSLDGAPVSLDNLGHMELNVGAKPFLLPVMDLLAAGRQSIALAESAAVPGSGPTASALAYSNTQPPPSDTMVFFSQAM